MTILQLKSIKSNLIIFLIIMIYFQYRYKLYSFSEGKSYLNKLIHVYLYLSWVFLISVCRAKFGESRNLEKMIGTPPLDDQMNISLQKNVLNSLQPPKTASTGPKFCCSQKDSFLKGSFRCSPNHIQHWNMECHTPLERSRIAFYGYVNFWSPNQTIWWPGAIEGFWR